MFKPNNTHTPKKNNRIDRENRRALDNLATPPAAELKKQEGNSRKRSKPDTCSEKEGKTGLLESHVAPYASAAAQRAAKSAPKQKAGAAAPASKACNGSSQLSRSGSSNSVLEAQLAESVADNEQLTITIEKLQAGRNRAEEALEKAKQEEERARAAIANEVAAREAAEEEAAAAKAKLTEVEASLLKRCTELAQEVLNKKRAQEESLELRAEMSSLQEELSESHAICLNLKERAMQQEDLRRAMHETIQESRNDSTIVKTPSGALEPTLLEVYPPLNESGDRRASSNSALMKPARFKFDRVFGESTPQDAIFKEIAQLTQSALDGYKVCIFAYGQTGSGKTFTMQGGSAEARGVVPRAAEQIFAHAADVAPLGWGFTFEASFLEIYNEELCDLLPVEVNPNLSSGGSKKEEKLRIIDTGSSVSVVGLRSAAARERVRRAVSLTIREICTECWQARSTATTKMNDHSSRSHFIFRLKVAGHNAKSGVRCEGELNLVDLAGSERVKDSGVTGEAMKEAQCINKASCLRVTLRLGPGEGWGRGWYASRKVRLLVPLQSLSALGDVIGSMSSKSKHIPFRNSKLTHLLADALSGSSKTLMFVNISPLARHHSESVSSLRFAAKAGGVEVGPAEKKMRKE
ncbi:MAG: hypothetical protein SGPRY_000086 [Prymnesium sp.]